MHALHLISHVSVHTSARHRHTSNLCLHTRQIRCDLVILWCLSYSLLAQKSAFFFLFLFSSSQQQHALNFCTAEVLEQPKVIIICCLNESRLYPNSVCVCVCSCMCDCVCACMCACDLFCYEVCSFCLSLRVGVFLFFLQSLENEISPLIFKTFCINGRTWYILAIS